MLLRKITLALITVAFLGGVAGADCCSDKADKQTSTTIKAGWFTAGGKVVGASSEANGECCKGLPAKSAECCKNQPAGQSSCGDKCASEKGAKAGECSNKGECSSKKK